MDQQVKEQIEKELNEIILFVGSAYPPGFEFVQEGSSVEQVQSDIFTPILGPAIEKTALVILRSELSIKSPMIVSKLSRFLREIFSDL